MFVRTRLPLRMQVAENMLARPVLNGITYPRRLTLYPKRLASQKAICREANLWTASFGRSAYEGSEDLGLCFSSLTAIGCSIKQRSGLQ
jgi:hypothetical protein